MSLVIKELGRWKSDSFLRYIHFPEKELQLAKRSMIISQSDGQIYKAVRISLVRYIITVFLINLKLYNLIRCFLFIVVRMVIPIEHSTFPTRFLPPLSLFDEKQTLTYIHTYTHTHTHTVIWKRLQCFYSRSCHLLFVD